MLDILNNIFLDFYIAVWDSLKKWKFYNFERTWNFLCLFARHHFQIWCKIELDYRAIKILSENLLILSAWISEVERFIQTNGCRYIETYGQKWKIDLSSILAKRQRVNWSFSLKSQSYLLEILAYVTGIQS